jgi:hypothetical protein
MLLIKSPMHMMTCMDALTSTIIRIIINTGDQGKERIHVIIGWMRMDEAQHDAGMRFARLQGDWDSGRVKAVG